jgi:pimeloyl-ACP methyl ester carboxylesterase
VTPVPKVDLNGVRVHYQQAGRGPDLVMVHGLGANLAFWGLRIAPLLARTHRLTLYDLRGHGYSGMPPHGYSTSVMADDLEALLDHLGVARAHVVAHSYGGGVALEHALANPDRVRSLTLADPVSPGLPPLGARTVHERRRQLRERIGELGLAPPSGRFADREERFVPYSAWNGAGGRSASTLSTLLQATSALDDFAQRVAGCPDKLSQLDAPVLCVVGGRSRYRPARRAIERRAPDCRSVTIPGVGHFHPVLRPREFAGHVLEHTAKTEAGAS